MSKTYGPDGNSKDNSTKRPPKPKGRPKEFVPPEVAPLVEALQAKGAASGADLQDQLILLGHYISERALNRWVDDYRKAAAAKKIAENQRAEQTRMHAEHAPNPIDTMVIDCADSIQALPDDMIIVVNDMLRGKRSIQAIQVALASFGFNTSEAAISAYADGCKDDIDPQDLPARLLAAARTLEAHTRVIRQQAIRVWHNMSARSKQDVKTYLALTKIGVDGQRALIDALKQIPTEKETNDVNSALLAIEQKLGLSDDESADDNDATATS